MLIFNEHSSGKGLVRNLARTHVDFRQFSFPNIHSLAHDPTAVLNSLVSLTLVKIWMGSKSADIVGDSKTGE